MSDYAPTVMDNAELSLAPDELSRTAVVVRVGEVPLTLREYKHK